MKEKKYRISLSHKEMSIIAEHLWIYLEHLIEKIEELQEEYTELTELEPFENYQYLKDELDSYNYEFFVLERVLSILSKRLHLITKQQLKQQLKQEDHKNDL